MLAAEIFGNGFAFTVGVVSGMSLYGGVQIVRCLRGDDDRGWIELAGSVGLMIGCGAMVLPIFWGVVQRPPANDEQMKGALLLGCSCLAGCALVLWIASRLVWGERVDRAD